MITLPELSVIIFAAYGVLTLLCNISRDIEGVNRRTMRSKSRLLRLMRRPLDLVLVLCATPALVALEISKRFD